MQTTHVRRRVVRSTLALVVLALAFGAGAAVNASMFHDARLDLADAQLESAYLLLAASQAGAVDTRTERAFYRHVGKAQSHIETARAEIVKAIAVVDGEQPAGAAAATGK